MSLYSLQHYFQQPRYGSNPSVHQQTNGHIYNGTQLSHQKKEIYLLWQHGWNLGTYAYWNKSGKRKTNTVWFHFYVKAENKKNKKSDSENRLVAARSNDWNRGRSGWTWWKGTNFQSQNLEKLPCWLALYFYWAAQGSTLSPPEAFLCTLPLDLGNSSMWDWGMFWILMSLVDERLRSPSAYAPCDFSQVCLLLCKIGFLEVPHGSYKAQTRQCTRPTSGA